MLELLSLHIPKCAGSALLSALNGIYGEDAVFRDYDPVIFPGSQINIDPESFLRDFAVRRGGVLAGKRVVHGHFYYPKYDGIEAPRITVLRHPVDRLISHYFYWKITPVKEGQVLRRYIEDNNITIEEFARMPALRYFYTRHFFRDVDMKSFDLIGASENLAPAMEKLSGLIGHEVTLVTENTNAFSDYTSRRDEITGDGRIMAALAESLSDDIRFYEAYALL